VTDVAALVSTVSGLRFVAPTLDAPTILGTGAVVQVCHGILCRIFAHNNGYPKNAWTALGLIGGLWAVGLLILLPRRGGAVAAKP